MSDSSPLRALRATNRREVQAMARARDLEALHRLDAEWRLQRRSEARARLCALGTGLALLAAAAGYLLGGAL